MHCFLCIVFSNGELYISFLATVMYIVPLYYQGIFRDHLPEYNLCKVSESQPGFMLPGPCNK